MSCDMHRGRALTLLVFLLGFIRYPNAEAEYSLEKVVVLARHGIRAPTKAPAAYAKYSAEPWPDWPVEPGELTAHGAEAVGLMGYGLRQHYAELGLLPGRDCPAANTVLVWADGSDQRTRASGEALVEGLALGCALHAGYGPPGDTDPLFHAPESGLCPADTHQAERGIAARMGTLLRERKQAIGRARALLQWIARPGTHGKEGSDLDAKEGQSTGGENRLRIVGGEVKLEGPLQREGTVSENLYLEFAQGFPGGQVGWGRAASVRRIANIMPLHELRAELMSQTPYVASHSGTFLARQLLDAVVGSTKKSYPWEVAIPAAARFIAFVGHGGNLSNLAGMLGLHWNLPGQPDPIAPDTVLALEVWRSKTGGNRVIRIKILYQTLVQLRKLTRLDAATPVLHVIVPIPDCTGALPGSCTMEEFEQRLGQAMARDCLHESPGPGQRVGSGSS